MLVAPESPVLAEAGADAAKCLALAAAAVSISSAHVEPLLHTLRLAIWSTGARGPDDLTPGHLRMPDPWRPPLV